MATMPLDGAFHRLNLNIGNIDSYPTCQDLDLTSSVPELSPASSGSQIVYTPISRDDRSPVTRAYQAYGSEGYNALPYIHNQQFMTPISRLSTEVENLTWSSPGSRNYGHGISGSTSSNRTGSSHSTISKMSPRPQSNDYASGHHNVVEIERIQLGLDVRTTIMLRNIPNKIDQAMLKEIIDETSYGKYDFMYLRIDFANNCNVGYAFINFEDPFYIIDFVKARAGNRWNRFNSDKVAEVSYATIQGKDCLVQKFRNSSVMLEHPSFRPKIYHTSSSPNVGEEDIFPSPDNPSKMRRSVENAEHVGLFAPRAGQQFRDQQRRRRSQYDRGTRLAEFEDSYEFEDRNIPAGFPHGFRSTPSPSYGHYQQNTYY
ncbi:hypothetical protein MMC25_000656 [Agyrium rufum]|nr:hypothetical protein [Agyrium rufum]